nr:hypothetical protein [Tanacetum cinerariifolium]
MGNDKKSVAERTHYKRQYDSRRNERHMQSKEGKVYSSKALDASLVVTKCSVIESVNSNSKHVFNKSVNESSGIESRKQDTSSSSGNYMKHAVDAYIRPTNDQVPFVKVQLTAKHNVLANEQQHTEQSEPIYDTYLLKKVDSNTTPDLTNMSHKGGEIDQDAKQYQEKVFANAALKNELRKLKGNSENTKFEKSSILGKPVLQPLRNQSVVRQPTAFRSKRPKFSKPRFASQVDVKDDLPKPVTPHYLPKVRESMFVKPHHVIASGSSSNSSNESYGSNDMAHKYYLE